MESTDPFILKLRDKIAYLSALQSPFEFEQGMLESYTQTLALYKKLLNEEAE